MSSVDEMDFFRMTKVVPGAIRTVAEVLMEAFVSERFGIITRLEFTMLSGKDEQGARSAVIIRCCFPRDRIAEICMAQYQDELVRCSGVLQEEAPGEVRIELSRPLRRFHSRSPEILELIHEVDQRLHQILDRF